MLSSTIFCSIPKQTQHFNFSFTVGHLLLCVSTNQPSSQPVSQVTSPSNQPVNKPNLPTNQPTNQLTNQRTRPLPNQPPRAATLNPDALLSRFRNKLGLIPNFIYLLLLSHLNIHSYTHLPDFGLFIVKGIPFVGHILYLTLCNLLALEST